MIKSVKIAQNEKDASILVNGSKRFDIIKLCDSFLKDLPKCAGQNYEQEIKNYFQNNNINKKDITNIYRIINSVKYIKSHIDQLSNKTDLLGDDRKFSEHLSIIYRTSVLDQIFDDGNLEGNFNLEEILTNTLKYFGLEKAKIFLDISKMDDGKIRTKEKLPNNMVRTYLSDSPLIRAKDKLNLVFDQVSNNLTEQDFEQIKNQINFIYNKFQINFSDFLNFETKFKKLDIYSQLTNDKNLFILNKILINKIKQNQQNVEEVSACQEFSKINALKEKLKIIFRLKLTKKTIDELSSHCISDNGLQLLELSSPDPFLNATTSKYIDSILNQQVISATAKLKTNNRLKKLAYLLNEINSEIDYLLN